MTRVLEDLDGNTHGIMTARCRQGSSAPSAPGTWRSRYVSRLTGNSVTDLASSAPGVPMCTLPSRDPFRRLEVVTREIGNGQANARCQVLGKLKDFGDLLFIGEDNRGPRGPHPARSKRQHQWPDDRKNVSVQASQALGRPVLRAALRAR